MPLLTGLRAALARFENDQSPIAEAIRQELIAHLGSGGNAQEPETETSGHTHIHQQAIFAARHEVHAMRVSGEIGDGAFHIVEEELDWIEMADRGETTGDAD